ncbi:hypothetical protein [Cellulomonas soli]
MRLFPHVHLTVDLDPALVEHLVHHGVRVVGPQDDPDVVVGLPAGALPAGVGLVALLAGAPEERLAALLLAAGVHAHPAEGDSPAPLCSPATDPAAAPAEDLLAWAGTPPCP